MVEMCHNPLLVTVDPQIAGVSGDMFDLLCRSLVSLGADKDRIIRGIYKQDLPNSLQALRCLIDQSISFRL